MAKTQIQGKVEDATIVELDKHAAQQRRTRSQCIELAVELWVAEQEALAERGDTPRQKGTGTGGV